MMDFDEINRILAMMREHELSEFELERDNFKLRIRKQGVGHWVAATPHAPPAPALPIPAPSAGSTAAAGAAGATAPVGTFYRASEPGARPFAEVGDIVKKGQVLCIIEAMKLMNEINAELDGEVMKAYVENGQAVQYGERLFAIKPA